MHISASTCCHPPEVKECWPKGTACTIALASPLANTACETSVRCSTPCNAPHTRPTVCRSADCLKYYRSVAEPGWSLPPETFHFVRVDFGRPAWEREAPLHPWHLGGWGVTKKTFHISSIFLVYLSVFCILAYQKCRKCQKSSECEKVNSVN